MEGHLEVHAGLEAIEGPATAARCLQVRTGGSVAQVVRIALGQGQAMWVSRGCLLAYDESVSWTLQAPGGAGKAARRMLAGEGLALLRVISAKDGAEVVLGADRPGRLAAWDLTRGAVFCTSGAFVGALGEVEVDVTMARRAGAALFGGAGLFLQKLTGSGVAIVHGTGDFLERNLAAGEKLLVSSGHLALFSTGVGYDVRGVGGCRRAVLGGEGLFVTELTGPGTVLLQTLKKAEPRSQGTAAS
jgi:uncharacterized protein (AIM24 family)